MKRGETLFVVAVLLLASGGLALEVALPPNAPKLHTQGSGRILSTGWVCPAPYGEGVSTFISTTNLGKGLVRLRRFGVGASRLGPYMPGDLKARSRGSIAASDLGVADAAAVVEAFGAQTTTDVESLAPGGVASSRCLSQPSDRWYFPVASTLRGRDSYLLVANPFEEEAVLRIRFMTLEEDVTPARLRDLVIPALGQTPVFLGDYFRETESFGVDVQATRGRVLITRYDRVNTRDGWRGTALSAGIREPSSRWYFAGGETPLDGYEYILLLNPGDREALVQLLFPTETEVLSPPELSEVPVPAGRQVVVKVTDLLPRGIRHGVLVVSSNNAPIVAERQTFGSLAGGRGYDSTMGVPAIAGAWVVPVGSRAGGSDTVAVVNFSQSKAVIRILLLTESGEVRPPELSGIAIEPNRRASIDVTPFIPPGGAIAVVRSSSGEIAVEHHILLGDPHRDFADSSGQPL